MISLSSFSSSLAFIEGIGGPELLMVMVIVLILFGGKKLPEFAKGLGKSIREIKKATSGVEEEFRRAIEEEPAKPPAKPVPKTTPISSPAPEAKPAAPAGDIPRT